VDTNDFNRRRDDGMLHQLDNRLAVVDGMTGCCISLTID
jgi:hypothetical protein